MNLDEIEQDLRAFADPSSPVIVEKNTAMWEQDGQNRTLAFSRAADGGLLVRTESGDQLKYRDFLAGPTMADLRRFANYILKTRTEPQGFIETTGTWQDPDGNGRTDAATKLIRTRSTEDLPAFSTRVVLVQGEAGAGKTIGLRELAYRQAAGFERCEVGQLFFYVDAQGRALARLEDAMAKDLQDLRSSFSYAAIAPLTRHHLVIPIIDGFDELLGSGGYDEAFASLAAFLSMLDGKGAVVASARSAFFDYRNFRDNAEKFSHQGTVNYEVDVVAVQPWSSDQVHAYVAKIAEDRKREPSEVLQKLSDLEAELDEANRRLLSKPFYAARVADLLLQGTPLSSGEALLDQLVDAFLEREHRKLLDKNGNPLLSIKGHRAFLVLLAEEMWWQESRRIDVRTVQAIAELVVESYRLPPGSAMAIVERVSSYAFLSTSESERKAMRFEHEVFYGYFLAHKLRECIEQDHTDLRRFLGRALIDESLAEQAARLVGSDVGRATRGVQAICSVLRQGLSAVVARENAGRLIADLISTASRLEPNTLFTDVIFKQVRFGECRLEEPHFLRCEFDDADLCGAVWEKPEFDNCALRSVWVELSTTRLAGANSDLAEQLFSVSVVDGDADIGAGRLFAPHEIEAVLGRLGVAIGRAPDESERYSDAARDRISLLDRFLRKMERRFYASEEDLAGFPFTREIAWSEVRALLEKHELLEQHYVQKSGPKQPLLKLRVPPETLRRGENLIDASVPVEVRTFWKELLGPSHIRRRSDAHGPTR
jgi:hypothetical protein